MDHLAFLVFATFFLVIAWSTPRLLRMSPEELEAKASEAPIGRLGIPAFRAPIGCLAASACAAVLSGLLLLVERTSFQSVLLDVVLVCSALSWVVLTVASYMASFWGHPAFLLHPRLRE